MVSGAADLLLGVVGPFMLDREADILALNGWDKRSAFRQCSAARTGSQRRQALRPS